MTRARFSHTFSSLGFYGKGYTMPEDRRKERVTRRTSTGARGGNASRAEKERIRFFDEEDERAAQHERRGDFDDRFDGETRGDERRDEGRRYDERRYHDRDERDGEETTFRRDPRSSDERARRANDAGKAEQNDAARRAPGGKNTSGNRKSSTRKGGNPESFANQIVPYVTFWLALFAGVSFILRDLCHLSGATGAFGNFFADFLCGLFGSAAYFVPIFAVVLSIRWKKLVRTGLLQKKLFLSASFILLLGGIIHTFKETRVTRADLDTAASVLYQNGVSRAGGGFFGGFVGEWIGYTLRLPGTVLLAIPLLVIVSIYLIGMTPGGIFERVRYKIAQMAKHHKERRAMLYDGEEERRLGGAAERPSMLQYKGRAPLPAGEETKRESASEYRFSDENDDEQPIGDRRAREQRKKEGAAIKRQTERRARAAEEEKRESETPAVVDIPDDVIEMEPSAAHRDVGRAERNEREVEDILSDLMRRSDAEAETARGTRVAETQTAADDKTMTVGTAVGAAPQHAGRQEAPATPTHEPEGTYYAPYALPVRPEPRRDRAEAEKSRIVVTPDAPVHAREEADAPAGETTVAEETTPESANAPANEVLGVREDVFAEAEGIAAREEASDEPYGAEPFTKREDFAKETPVVGYTFAYGANSPIAAEEVATADAEPAFDEDDVFDEAKKTETVSIAPESRFAFATDEKSAPAETFENAEESGSDDFPAAVDEEDAQLAKATSENAAKAPFSATASRFSLGEERTRIAFEPVIVDEENAEDAAVSAPAPSSVPFRNEPVREEKAPTPPPPPAPTTYHRPPLSLLCEDTQEVDVDYTAENEEKIAILRETLASFGVGIREDVLCSRGPTITRYELRPEAGVSVRAVVNRADDLSLNLAAQVRIEAPILGKAAIGVEVPNAVRRTVYERTLLESPAARASQKPLEVPIGVDVGGNICLCDIASMPHLLIAGTTGSGKSVCINSILISLMYKTSPADLRLILIDPKQVEFAAYAHAPHLYAPIVTDMMQAAGVLACAVKEMERRYNLLKSIGVREIKAYNNAVKNDPEREHLPYMVIVIDEFSDLIMSCPNNDVEDYTCRLAQKARAAGIHLIIGTQRPTVDVITGKLKANIPSRIAFTVKQQIDSRTILDMNGAEVLTGRGDMLYAPTGSPKPIRLQGAYLRDEEVSEVMDYVREHNDPVQYNRAFMEEVEAEAARVANAGKKTVEDFDEEGDGGGEDRIFYDALSLAVDEGKISTSLLQRRLSIGYGRAAKLIDRMEDLGYVGEPEGNKARKVLLSPQRFAELMSRGAVEGEEDF